MLRARHLRLRRLVVFAGELVRTLVRELAPQRPGRPTAPLGTGGDLDLALAAFQAELADIVALVQAGEVLVGSVPNLAEPEAVRLLDAFEPDLARLTRVASQLEERARPLRQRVAARASAAASAAGDRPAVTGPLSWVQRMERSKLFQQAVGQDGLGALRRLAAAPDVREAKAGPAPPLPPAVLQAHEHFERARKFAGQVLGYAAPRLRAVRVAIDLTGLPARRRPVEAIDQEGPAAISAAEVLPELRSRVAPLARHLHVDAQALRLAHVAVVQGEEAERMCADAAILDAALQHAPADRLAALLQEMPPGKLEAAVSPISHLHVTMRGVPPLAALFPGPKVPPRAVPSPPQRPRTLGEA